MVDGKNFVLSFLFVRSFVFPQLILVVVRDGGMRDQLVCRCNRQLNAKELGPAAWQGAMISPLMHRRFLRTTAGVRSIVCSYMMGCGHVNVQLRPKTFDWWRACVGFADVVTGTLVVRCAHVRNDWWIAVDWRRASCSAHVRYGWRNWTTGEKRRFYKSG